MNIYQIVSTLLWIVFGFLVTYLKTKTDIIDLAKEEIGHAEMAYQEAHSGERKMEYVVQYIYKLIPVPMRIIFTEDAIRSIVQNVFDSIEKYATIQLDKIKEHITNK